MMRRDARREDDDRRPPRDRDLFEGRGDRGGRDRGGRRDGRSDRDEFAMQMGGRDRKKSASPPPKKKEPTPDLTDVVPITDRKRRLTQWDIKPPGYENVTAEQAKLSGKPACHGQSHRLIIEQGCFLFRVPHDNNQWIPLNCKLS